VGGRSRRHRRRGGWAKRAAVRAAVEQNRGEYWCEFGELLTPKMAAKFGGARPGGGGVSSTAVASSGGVGVVVGAAAVGRAKGVAAAVGAEAGAGAGAEAGALTPRVGRGGGGEEAAVAIVPARVSSYRRAGWIEPARLARPTLSPQGSLTMSLLSLSLPARFMTVRS